jgi:hypothetical protein
MAAPETVTPFVEEMARSGIERFRPSYVAQRTGAELPTAHAVLAALKEAGELDAHYELVCSNDSCHRTLAQYESLDAIPFGETVVCKTCGTGTLVDLSQVWAYYTPSRQLLLRVNRAAAEEAGQAKKKVLMRIRQLLDRLTMR